MTPERWQQVKIVLEAALNKPAARRDDFLSKACGADEELLVEVESLLAFDSSGAKDVFENGRIARDENLQDGDAYASGFVGKTIGKYRIVRELGAGGMGVVFLAERADGEFEQKVAVKFLRHFFSQSAVKLFLLERKILARLRHRYIAQLIDGGTTAEGTPYLVMEYIEGVPVIEYANEKNLNLEQRLHLFRKICSAVSFAHRNLIVHRDLKPDNILITAEGTPKLLDFGIAKLLSDNEIKATVTRRQAFTPEYASPEQISGGTITTASDVYVLGIILYELLSGKRPFQNVADSDRKEAWFVVNRTEPPKPSQQNAESGTANAKFKNGKLPPESENVPKNPHSALRVPHWKDLDNIVLKALKREPERRYKAVEQLLEDLRRYEKGLPVAARADTFFYRTSKFIGRNRFAIVAAFLVFASLLVGFITTLQQSRRAERERLIAERRAENLRAVSKAVLFDIHDAIRNLPGSLPAREILLKRAVEQLQILASDAGGDNAELQNELAQAYFNVGEMQQALGSISEAEESHRRAAAIYQNLYEKFPQNSAYRRGLALAYGYLANMAYLRGESSRSSELYAEARVIFEQIADENPNDAKILYDFWNANYNYAVSLNKLGRWNDALQVAEKCAETANRINEIEASKPESRQSVIQTNGLIAAIYGFSGEYQKSIALYKETIFEAEKLRAEFPDDTRFQYNLWAFHRRLGIVYGKTGNFTEAVSNLKKALGFIENLLQSSPKDAGYKRNTSITLLALGQTFLDRKEPRSALDFLKKSRELSEALFAGDAENGETIADLASIYGTLAAALERANQPVEAVALYEKSFDYFARALSKTPENAELKRERHKIAEYAAAPYDKDNEAKAVREKALLLLRQSENVEPAN